MAVGQITTTDPHQAAETEDVFNGPSPAALADAEQRLSSLLTETRQIDEDAPIAPIIQNTRQDIAKYLRWFRMTDLAAFFCAAFGAWLLATIFNLFFLGRSLETQEPNADLFHFAQFIAIASGVMVWFEHTGHYRTRMPFWLETKKIIGALSFAMMIDGFLQFATKLDLSRVWLMSGWFIAGATIIAFRKALRDRLRRKGKWQVPTLLVGNGATAEAVRTALLNEPSLGYDIKAQIGDLAEAFHRANDSWELLCARHGAAYIVIALDSAALMKAELPLAQLIRETVPFSVAPSLRHVPVFGIAPHYFINHDVLLMTRYYGLEQPFQRFIKRCFDALGASVALLFLSPLTAIMSLSALLTKTRFFADRSALYRYRWSRLADVVRGKMSLVGPSVPPALHTLNAGHMKASDRAQTCARPGVTGLWQINREKKLSSSNRRDLETWYVHNWSLWQDIAILCKTVTISSKR